MTFEKYNANPENKNIGDCSIRAICTATPLTYQQANTMPRTGSATRAKVKRPHCIPRQAIPGMLALQYWTR